MGYKIIHREHHCELPVCYEFNLGDIIECIECKKQYVRMVFILAIGRNPGWQLLKEKVSNGNDSSPDLRKG